MKNLFLLLCLCLMSKLFYAQDTAVEYYTEKWKVCEKSEHEFYGKKFAVNDSLWGKLDFFKDGKLQMIGFYKTDSFKTKHGKFIYFKQNGDTSSIYEFYNGKKHGVHVEFFDNGNPNVRTIIINGLQNGSTVYYYENGNPSSTGKFKHGIRHGEWKYYFKDGKYNTNEFFILKYEAPCGYSFDLPARWIHTSEDQYGTTKDGISVDWIYRKSVRTSSGEEQIFFLDAICLNRPHFSADDVCKNMIRGSKVKAKKIKSYKDWEIDFDGVMYSYREKGKFGKKLEVLLIAQKKGDNILQIKFNFEKKVDETALKEIIGIIESISW